jgi:predicted transcriptional regulator
MNIEQLIVTLNLQVYGGLHDGSREITGGYTSDLLSDVMGNARAGMVWITLQTHKNVLAIASLKELAAVVLVKGYQPDADMLEKCDEEKVPVLGTTLDAFEISGLIWNLLQSGNSKTEKAQQG